VMLLLVFSLSSTSELSSITRTLEVANTVLISVPLSLIPKG